MDVRKFFGLLLKQNRYLLEQLFSPLISCGALKAITDQYMPVIHVFAIIGLLIFGGNWQDMITTGKAFMGQKLATAVCASEVGVFAGESPVGRVRRFTTESPYEG